MNHFVRRPAGFYIGAMAAFAVLCSSIPGRADIIKFSGFEDDDTWSFVLSGTGISVSTANPSTDSPPSQRVLGGTHSLQINSGTGTADFSAINVAAFDSIQLTIRISSPSATSGNGNDTNEAIKLFVSVDGAAYSGTPDITIGGSGNSRWGYTATKTATTNAGAPISFTAQTSTTSDDNYSTLVVNIPNSASSVRFKVTGNNDNAGEFWAIDNITLSGTPTSIPEPSAAMALLGGVGVLCGLQRRRRVA